MTSSCSNTSWIYLQVILITLEKSPSDHPVLPGDATGRTAAPVLDRVPNFLSLSVGSIVALYIQRVFHVTAKSMLNLPGCHCDPLYRPRCSARWGTWFSLGYEGHNMSWLSAGQWTEDAPWLREESAKANMCIFNKNSKNVIAQ